MNPLRTVLAAALLGPLAAAAADLRVTVADGPATASPLYVAMFDSAEGFATGKSIAAQVVPLRDGGAQMVFVGLPAGRYALKLFVDQNGNGKLDANPLGLPVERHGFSNDARGTMGPPTFDAAAVRLDGDASITVHLR
ncbi:DUF2141 domain-containing protein [Variovorax saccharolyticus]|uniref:DUF2141 domain-containing protein n=1 Tax=Variovorax saccharolyticus TaxID=3053516 RepID=UPI002576BEE3|nr:DUF2141 domain-containing protein [Variovorax sp. J22R187]MDM0019778.1 DUF2141 domain-containing protein [Variovorax sp. J22R187]